jgi:hypothetical protein
MCVKHKHSEILKIATQTIAFILLSLFVFASCALPDGGYNDSSDDPGGESSEKGSLLIDVRFPTSGIETTIEGGIDMSPANYGVSGVGPGGAAFIVSQDHNPIEQTGLPFGEWTVAVDLQNSSGVFIARGESTVTIDTRTTTPVEIVVSALDGYGSLDLTVNWPPEDTENPSILSRLILSTGTSTELLFDMVAPGQATYSSSTIPSGYHTLEVQLWDRGYLLTGAIEVVRIVNEQTTSGVFNFAQVNQPEGRIAVYLTPELNDPIDVTILDQPTEVYWGEEVTVRASVPSDVGNVVYVWYLNGVPQATGSTFTITNDTDIGLYRLDVTAFTADGRRAGSTSHMFSVLQGAQVSLTWDENSETDIAGYRLYYGSVSGQYDYVVDVGNQTNYTLNGLRAGQTYYIAATAYNTSGYESDYSNEVNTVPSL